MQWPLEVTIPLSVLGQGGLPSPRKEDERVHGDPSRASVVGSSQRMAVCEHTGLVAIANGSVIDLYQLDNLILREEDPCGEDKDEGPAVTCRRRRGHLPYGGQIRLLDHLLPTLDPREEEAEAHCIGATMITFVARGFLVVAVSSSTSADFEGFSAMETRHSWLCGFRVFPRSVVLARSEPSRLLVHVAFADPFPGDDVVIAADRVNGAIFSEESGALIIRLDASPTVAIFKWSERFSNRELILLSLPHRRPASIVATAVSDDGKWVTLADASGTLYLVDFRAFPWAPDRLNPVGTSQASTEDNLYLPGPSIELVHASRMGVTVQEADVRHVRIVHETRICGEGVTCTALRWWDRRRKSRHQPERFLLVGHSDGSLAFTKLSSTLASDVVIQLKLLEVYPAPRKMKGDAVLSISCPRDLVPSVSFCVVSRSHARLWSLRLSNQDSKLNLPTLRDSLDFKTIPTSHSSIVCTTMLERQPKTNSQAEGEDPAIRRHDLIFRLTDTDLSILLRSVERVDEQAPEPLISGPMHISVVSPTDRQVSKTPCMPSSGNMGDPPTEKTVPSERTQLSDDFSHEVAVCAQTDSSIAEVPDTVLTARDSTSTLCERYELPQMLSKTSHITTSGALRNEGHRLQREEFNQELHALSRRVHTLSSTLSKLHKSFRVFSDDVQAHMNHMSEQLRRIQADAGIIDNMEKGYLQASAEAARFDPDRRRQTAAQSNQTAPVIPHLKEKYDPDHPDADWGGYVQRSYKKKVYTDHVAARDNLVLHEKGGLMPDESAQTKGESFSGKKIFEPERVPSGDPTVPGIQFQSAVYQLGPGGDLSCKDWKTSYRAQASMEGTPQDVYALGTVKNTQHKRHVVPMYDKSSQERRSSASPNGSFYDSNNNGTGSRGSSPSGLVGSPSAGSLSGRRLEPRKSLLAGIGKLVAAEDTNNQLLRPEHHLTETFKDPVNKTLLVENHHNITLGYTGKKNSFRR